MTELPISAPISAGEAFTYIDSVRKPTIDDLKLMVFLEAYGFHAYNDLAACAPNDKVRRLLEANAQEEFAHAQRLVEVIRLMSGEDFAVPPRAGNPYVADWRREVTRELLENRVQSEAKGGALYSLWAENIGHEKAAELLLLSASEEESHAARMAQAIPLLE